MKLKNITTFPKSFWELFRLPLSNGGFTLIEILVVVLIIGILGAIALPQYQRAVLKSRYSGMMPIAKALAEANEVFYLEHGEYSENPADLLVAGRDKNDTNAYPDGTRIVMYSDAEDLSFVRTENDNISNARYVVYQKHSKNFADTTMCEAADERADELCVALGGVSLPSNMQGNSSGSGDWNVYLLSGQLKDGDSFAAPGGCSGSAPANVTARQSGATGTATCVNGQWKYEWTGGTTYSEDREICESDSAYACAGSTFSGEWSACLGFDANGCVGSTFSGYGSYCYGERANACAGSTFSGEWSGCNGYGANGCAGTIIQAGSYCYADAEGACDNVTYTTHPDKGNTLTGCCYGTYCPAGSPKCIVDSSSNWPIWNDTTHAFDIDGTW